MDSHAAPSIKVTSRSDRSLFMLLLHTVIRPFARRITSSAQQKYPAGSPQLEPDKKAKKRVRITERKVEDIYIYDLSSKQEQANANETKRRTRLHYFSGGGWQSPASSEHWGLLADMVLSLPDMAISLVSYPLAPNSPASISFPLLMSLYRALMKEADDAGEKVILVGDSAGGNVVLCLILQALWQDTQVPAQDHIPPCPEAVFVMSPSTNLERSNPDMEIVQKKDPLLRIPFVEQTAKAWYGNWDPSDPRVSPLYADVSLLAKRGVKVHGVTGGYDILAPDAVLFREKCNEASVNGEWLQWDKQMHCFPLAFSYKLRESVEAKEWILDVLRRT